MALMGGKDMENRMEIMAFGAACTVVLQGLTDTVAFGSQFRIGDAR